jgi:thiol-disulfide isomerase/thioredoxin
VPLAVCKVGAHLRDMMRRLAVVLILLLGICVRAEEAGLLSFETEVKQMVASKDVTVVHFWAPWCGNCIAEQRDDGWANFIARNPDVRFVFIEIWNDGKDSRESLAKFNIGAQKNLTLLVDPRPRRGEGRMRTFMDLPVTWTPTTWVFREGRQQFAFNYGEVRFPILQQLVDDAGADW